LKRLDKFSRFENGAYYVLFSLFFFGPFLLVVHVTGSFVKDESPLIKIPLLLVGSSPLDDTRLRLGCGGWGFVGPPDYPCLAESARLMRLSQGCALARGNFEPAGRRFNSCRAHHAQLQAFNNFSD